MEMKYLKDKYLNTDELINKSRYYKEIWVKEEPKIVIKP